MNNFTTSDPNYFISDDNNILQSNLWADFQKSLGKKAIKINQNSFSFLAIVETTPIGKYLFVPYGPYLATPAQLSPAIKEIKQIAKQEHAIFARLEPTLPLPNKTLKNLGCKKVKDINPKETWILELPEKNEDLRTLFPKRLRGYYNQYKNNGISIKKSNNQKDIEHLSRLQKETFRDKNITPYKKEYLKAELAQSFATLYLASFQEKVIATVLVFDDDNTRYYMQAASDKNYKSLNANGILTIRAIIDAKAKGLSFFDFWGIAPKNASPSHPWFGFTTFKKSFKGKEKIYSGTYDLPINRAKYHAYRTLKSIKNTARKLKK